MSTPIGDKIHELRKKKGYTLEKLAELTGSSKSYIWELENKNLPRPSGEKVAKLALHLGVTADYLMDVSTASPSSDVMDKAFFRDYKSLSPDDKDKLRDLVGLWGKKK